MFEFVTPDYSWVHFCLAAGVFVFVAGVIGLLYRSAQLKKKHGKIPAGKGDTLDVLVGTMFIGLGSLFLFGIGALGGYTAGVSTASKANIVKVEQYFEEKYVGEFAVDPAKSSLMEFIFLEGSVESSTIEVSTDEGKVIYELSLDKDGSLKLGEVISGFSTGSLPELVEK